MDGFILYRFDGQRAVIMGAYTSLALAETARDTKLATYVANQNAQRDVDHAAGLACNELLAVADVFDLVFIEQVIVNK